MQPVILDTDVASLGRKRKLAGPLATRLIGRRPLITFVTFGELTKWAEIRHWGNRNRQALADWLSGFRRCPATSPSQPCGAGCPRPRFSAGADRVVAQPVCHVCRQSGRDAQAGQPPRQHRNRHLAAR